jgi:hypothetical protein
MRVASRGGQGAMPEMSFAGSAAARSPSPKLEVIGVACFAKPSVTRSICRCNDAREYSNLDRVAACKPQMLDPRLAFN